MTKTYCGMTNHDRDMGWECPWKTGEITCCDECSFVEKVEVDDGQGN